MNSMAHAAGIASARGVAARPGDSGASAGEREDRPQSLCRRRTAVSHRLGHHRRARRRAGQEPGERVVYLRPLARTYSSNPWRVVTGTSRPVRARACGTRGLLVLPNIAAAAVDRRAREDVDASLRRSELAWQSATLHARS